MTLHRPSLREQVRDSLLRDILEGRYQPGDRLLELKIAGELGTSQAPVREALRELEALGFVVSRRNRGTVVGDVWKRGLREIYAVRGGLEELATRLATPLFAGDASTLQAEVDAMRAAAEQRDVEALVEHSYRFHREILLRSGNHLLLSVWQGLQIEARTAITMMAPGLDLEEIALSHQPIVDAIAAGNIEHACQVTREHQQFFARLPTPDEHEPAAVSPRAG